MYRGPLKASVRDLIDYIGLGLGFREEVSWRLVHRSLNNSSRGALG